MIRSDVDKLVDELCDALTIAQIGLDPEWCRRVGQDAHDTAVDLISEIMHRAAPLDPEQVAAARNLEYLGQELLHLNSARRRVRMKNRLAGQLRRASSDGLGIRTAVASAPRSTAMG
jgi:hypothetical protein